MIGEAGLSFPVGDVTALRGLLSRILGSPALVRQYRKLGSERARVLPGWDEVAARTEELYYRILA